MLQYYISFAVNQQVFNYSLVVNNSKESHYYLQLCFMQVPRDHELVLSCTRNLVLVFSITILLTTQDVSGESILSQRVANFLRKRNLKTKSKVSFIGKSFRRKDNFHNSFHNSLLLIFTYILQDIGLQKWNVSLFLISFCLFIGSCYMCQCIWLHLRPISHIFLSFILIHLSHFIKFLSLIYQFEV